MNRKLPQLLQPSLQLYFICLVLFALASAMFSLPLAVLELAVVVVLALHHRSGLHKRRREITKYIENITGNVDIATKDTMVNSPLPMIIFRPESGDIIWTNDRFLQLTGDKEHLFDAKLETVLPDFDTRWLLEGKSECPDEVKLGERRFLVYGHLVRASERGGGFLATTYWVDVTELANTRDRYQASRPAAAVLLLDNYEDLMKNLTENQRSTIYSEINARLDAWAAGTGGMLRRMERDRYLFLFEQQYLSRFQSGRFFGSFGTHAVSGEVDFLAEQFFDDRDDVFERELVFRSLRTSQVRHQDRRSAAGQHFLDGRNGRPDTGIVGYVERCVQRYIEVNADNRPFACEIVGVD